MLRLITLKDCKSHLEKTIVDIRNTFADVFSTHYAKLLAPPLQKAISAGEVKVAEDLKSSSDPILQGFSDLLPKKHFFEKPISSYNETELQTAFKRIYSGPGFDDEAAFLLAFYDLNFTESKSARDHYNHIKTRLKPEDSAEVENYLRCLDERKCELKEVNFLALVDNKTIRGFAIFHVFQEGAIQTLHVRQAAMREQSRGYASVMSRYFTIHYPKTFYEANQRKANTVLMKKALVEAKLMEVTEAKLGYNPHYYLGLRGSFSILFSFLEHYKITPDKLFTKFGKYYEAESVNNFFKPARLHRESFALQDANFAKDKLSYLRKK